MFGRGAGNPKGGWRRTVENSRSYTCVDGTDVRVQGRTPGRKPDNPESTGGQNAPPNEIAYGTNQREKSVRVLVSGTEFCRSVLRVVRGARDIRTVAFPKTVRWAENGAFRSKTLKSAVLNEGLEVLGYYKGHYLSDIFANT